MHAVCSDLLVSRVSGLVFPHSTTYDCSQLHTRIHCLLSYPDDDPTKSQQSDCLFISLPSPLFLSSLSPPHVSLLRWASFAAGSKIYQIGSNSRSHALLPHNNDQNVMNCIICFSHTYISLLSPLISHLSSCSSLHRFVKKKNVRKKCSLLP